MELPSDALLFQPLGKGTDDLVRITELLYTRAAVDNDKVAERRFLDCARNDRRDTQLLFCPRNSKCTHGLSSNICSSTYAPVFQQGLVTGTLIQEADIKRMIPQLVPHPAVSEAYVHIKHGHDTVHEPFTPVIQKAEASVGDNPEAIGLHPCAMGNFQIGGVDNLHLITAYGEQRLYLLQNIIA